MPSITTLSIRKRDSKKEARRSMAFLLEALMLLLFLTISLTVFMQLFATSHIRSSEANELSYALVLATNDAESFAADPLARTQTTFFETLDHRLVAVDAPTDSTYEIARNVRTEAREGGALYRAEIQVIRHETVLYRLNTARYISREGVL
ncbi:MAG: hypothetical protein RR671_03510 [Raoultibacter sp.]